MWRNWNPLNPPINPANTSDEEEHNNYESADENDLVSPNRPHQSPSASPRALLRPDPPRVEEVLQEVQQQLRHLPSREQRAANRNAVRQAQEAAEAAAEAAAAAPADLPLRQNIVPIMTFETENGVDEPKALTDALRQLVGYQWNPDDLLFYFGQVEIKMAANGVKKQFTKLQVLSSILPPHVVEEVKPILRLTEDQFPNNDSYKQLKTEILSIFGPRQEEGVERALGRVLTGKPSTLARQLVDDIAKGSLDCPNCTAVVAALWKRHLSTSVKAKIADIKLTKENFKEVCQKADDVHVSNNHSVAVAAVRVAPTEFPAGAAAGAQSLNETLPGLQYPVPEVNAIRSNRGGRGRGRGWRGGRGGRGGGNQNQNQNQASSQTSNGSGSGPKHKGTKHPDLPAGDWAGCSMHFKFGRSAFFCSEPATCPWKNVFTPRSNNK